MADKQKFDKEDSLQILIPNGSPAGTYEFKYESEQVYKQIKGIAFYQISNGGLANYRIGIDDGSVTYQYPVSYIHLSSNQFTPQNERAKDYCIPSGGRTIYFRVTTYAVTTSDLDADIVIGLVK